MLRGECPGQQLHYGGWRIPLAQLKKPPLAVATSAISSKVLKIINPDNVANVDTTELKKVLTATTNRLNGIQMSLPPRRFTSSVIRFDDLTVLNNSGVQILSSKSLKQLSDGVVQITLPVATSHVNYGVLLSMNIDNKIGVIQYANQTRATMNILTFDLNGKPTAFSGNFTIEIII